MFNIRNPLTAFIIIFMQLRKKIYSDKKIISTCLHGVQSISCALVVITHNLILKDVLSKKNEATSILQKIVRLTVVLGPDYYFIISGILLALSVLRDLEQK